MEVVTVLGRRTSGESNEAKDLTPAQSDAWLVVASPIRPAGNPRAAKTCDGCARTVDAR